MSAAGEENGMTAGVDRNKDVVMLAGIDEETEDGKTLINTNKNKDYEALYIC